MPFVVYKLFSRLVLNKSNTKLGKVREVSKLGYEKDSP